MISNFHSAVQTSGVPFSLDRVRFVSISIENLPEVRPLEQKNSIYFSVLEYLNATRLTQNYLGQSRIK